jgi:LAGLIDADG endonuclease
VGTISAQSKDSVQYRVASLKDLNGIIIPHFEKYPLITQKKADFILFKKIIDLINNKEHLTLEGWHKILALKGSLNLGLSEELKKNFPDIIKIERPLVENQKIMDPNWLTGCFASSGEGCFHVKIKSYAASKSKLGIRISLLFKITQHVRDKELMKSFIDYLDCGSVRKNSTWIDYTVVNYNDLIFKIVPFFDKYKIIGVKLQDYLDFKRVSELMKTKDHLTTLGLDKIKEIKKGMNKGR